MSRLVFALTVAMLILAAPVPAWADGADAGDEAKKAEDKTPAVIMPKKSNELPVFGRGPWKGNHAVYQHAMFQAAMDAKGTLWIQPVEDNKPVGRRFSCYQLSPVYYPPKSHQRGRPIVSFQDAGEPVMQPEKIHLKGMLNDGVSFEILYEFKADTIFASGGCADPAGIEHPTVFRMACIMGKSHGITPQTEQEDREKILKGCTLETREVENKRKKRFVYPYHDILKFSGEVEEAKAQGPWGKRVVEMMPRKIEGSFRGYVYSGNCPWQGYWIYLNMAGNKQIDLRKNTVMLRVR